MDPNTMLNDDIDMLNSVELDSQSNDIKRLKDQNEFRNHNEDIDLDEFCAIETETKTPGEILDDFCSKLDDINTTLPDSVITHYMKKTGFIVNDPKLVKIISIASQKFISEIVNDVMQHHKLKSKTSSTSGAQAPANSMNPGSTVPNNNGNPSSSANANQAGISTQSQQPSASTSSANVAKQSKVTASTGLTLTLEDLSQVLTEYGINVKKPYYFM